MKTHVVAGSPESRVLQYLQKYLILFLATGLIFSCRLSRKKEVSPDIVIGNYDTVLIRGSLNMTLSEGDSSKEVTYRRIKNDVENERNNSVLAQFRIDPFILKHLEESGATALILFPDNKIIDLRSKQTLTKECTHVLYDIVSGLLFSFSTEESLYAFFETRDLPLNSPFSGILCTSEEGELISFRAEGDLSIPSESLSFFENQYMLSRGFQHQDGTHHSGLFLTDSENDEFVTIAATLIGGGFGFIVAAKFIDNLLSGKPKAMKDSGAQIPKNKKLKKSELQQGTVKKLKIPDGNSIKKSMKSGNTSDISQHAGTPFSGIKGGQAGDSTNSTVPYMFKSAGVDFGSPDPAVPKKLGKHTVYKATKSPLQGITKKTDSGISIASDPVTGASRLVQVRKNNPVKPGEGVVIYKSLSEDKLNKFHIVSNKSGRALIAQGPEGTCNPSSALNAFSSLVPGLTTREVNRVFSSLIDFDYDSLGTLSSIRREGNTTYRTNYVLSKGQKGYSNGVYLAEAFNKHVRHTSPDLKKFTMKAETLPEFAGKNRKGAKNRWYAEKLLETFEKNDGKPLIISTNVNKGSGWTGHAVTLENIEKLDGEIWLKGINSWGIEFTVKAGDPMYFPGYEKIFKIENGTRTVSSADVPFRLKPNIVTII